MSITVLVAEDHTIVRQGICALLDGEPDIIIVGEAETLTKTLALVPQCRPDVVVLDLFLNRLPSIDVIRKINEHYPKTSVIILSMYHEDGYVVEALKQGARGYILKGSDSRELIRAIRQAVQGGDPLLSSQIDEHAIFEYMQKTQNGKLMPIDTLTNREREVMHLVVSGKSNANIAEQLSISIRTVETHRARMMEKLDVHSIAELIKYAHEHRIIPQDDRSSVTIKDEGPHPKLVSDPTE